MLSSFIYNEKFVWGSNLSFWIRRKVIWFMDAVHHWSCLLLDKITHKLNGIASLWLQIFLAVASIEQNIRDNAMELPALRITAVNLVITGWKCFQKKLVSAISMILLQCCHWKLQGYVDKQLESRNKSQFGPFYSYQSVYLLKMEKLFSPSLGGMAAQNMKGHWIDKTYRNYLLERKKKGNDQKK